MVDQFISDLEDCLTLFKSTWLLKSFNVSFDVNRELYLNPQVERAIAKFCLTFRSRLLTLTQELKLVDQGPNKPRRYSLRTRQKQLGPEELLRNHQFQLHGEKGGDNGDKDTICNFFCCKDCHRVYRDEETFRSHHQCCTKESGNQAYFQSFAIIQKHNHFICGYCSLECLQFDRMHVHVKQCRGGPFSCGMCQATFMHEEDLVGHKEDHHSDEKPFRCHLCKEDNLSWFKLNTSLQDHLIKQHEKKPPLPPTKKDVDLPSSFFCCQTCHRVFRDEESFKTHQQCGSQEASDKTYFKSLVTVQEHNHFICGYCLLECQQFDRMEIHVKQCRGGPFSCIMCQETFMHEEDLVGHKEDHHSNEKPFRCHLCKEDNLSWFKLNTSLQDHLSNQHEKTSPPAKEDVDVPINFFCCQTCRRVFRDEESFKTHQQFCSQEEASNKTYFKSLAVVQQHNHFICGHCLLECRQLDRMQHHVKQCDGGPLSCYLCQATFVHKKDLIGHKKDHHSDKKPFLCHLCMVEGKSSWFKMNSSLQKHLIQQHEKKPSEPTATATLECDQCSKKFTKRVYLTNHKVRFHNLEKSFLCQTCGNFFLTRNSLNRHLVVNHSSESKPKYVCQHCQKGFQRRDRLNLHVASHTGERPHQCHVCGHGFLTTTKLNYHFRCVHDGEKQFSCPACLDKRYKTSNDLRRHIQRCHESLGQHLKPNVSLLSQLVGNLTKE